MTEHLTVQQKYADPEVVKFWQKLGEQGLQKAEQEMVNRYFPPTGHLLDIGCGAGRAVLGLSQQGYTVTGIDLSVPMLLAGRSLSADMQLSGANLLTLPFVDNAFTAAFMFFGALQHLPGRQTRRKAFAEMARVVKKDGYLILGLDNLAPALVCYAYWFKEKIAGKLDSLTAPKNENLALTPQPPLPNWERGSRASDGGEGEYTLFSGKITPQTGDTSAASDSADTTLWGRDTNPLLWHLRGIARSLRWRTWPGLIDMMRTIYTSPNGPEPGDMQVAQFSRPATPGKVYYHIYRVTELGEDAAQAGWKQVGYHTGRELSENSVYPPAIKARDKQLFFAFQKG